MHYKSDSAAGKVLAEESFKLLKKCRSVSSTSTTKPGIIQRAKQEWEPRN